MNVCKLCFINDTEGEYCNGCIKLYKSMGGNYGNWRHSLARSDFKCYFCEQKIKAQKGYWIRKDHIKFTPRNMKTCNRCFMKVLYFIYQYPTNIAGIKDFEETELMKKEKDAIDSLMKTEFDSI